MGHQSVFSLSLNFDNNFMCITFLHLLKISPHSIYKQIKKSNLTPCLDWFYKKQSPLTLKCQKEPLVDFEHKKTHEILMSIKSSLVLSCRVNLHDNFILLVTIPVEEIS